MGEEVEVPLAIQPSLPSRRGRSRGRGSVGDVLPPAEEVGVTATPSLRGRERTRPSNSDRLRQLAESKEDRTGQDRTC